jgi:LuxR family maltose regulon positive regulatory protein
MPGYVARLLAAFEAETQMTAVKSSQPLVDPLSQRELEVLQLIAQGLSNDEIGKRLFLALDTVKGHNRRIYDKLQVQRRTEAVARARELGLL